MKSISSIFLLFFLFNSITVKCVIIGEPKIKCAPTGITVLIDVDSPFKGALFLRGSADKKSCKADFSKNPAAKNISFEFGFEDCPSRRKRQIVQPRGMTMSSVLVVSYHGSIITHKDVAYQIDCFYREEHSQVQTLLNVTAPKPLVLSDQPKLPICDYKVEVAAGSTKGGVVTSSIGGNSPVVTVGESVVHVWTCSGDAPNDVYCMQVHSCMADDGDLDQIEVVDNNGCTTDDELVSPIHYNGKSMRAAATSQAFKFADKHLVYFKCSIRLTVKTPNETCPINNCAPLTRNTRAIDQDAQPLFIFSRFGSILNENPKKQQYEVVVTSPEMLVEPENLKNHLMSTYKPPQALKNSSKSLINLVILFVGVLFMF